MPAAHRLSSSHSVAPPVVAAKRRRSSAVHAITAAVEPLERRLCLSAASLTPLGNLGGAPIYGTWAGGVSGDGSVIVGYSDSASGLEAFRWTSDGGMVALGYLPGGGFNWSWANGVSAEGSVIVGHSLSASGYEAFRWTSGGGMVGLGDLPGGSFESQANGVSADGSVIVGYSSSASGSYGEAFRWTSGGGMVGLGDLPGGEFYSSASRVSADGSVVVGGGSSASGGEAFRWTSDGGMVGLGKLPGGDASQANGVNGDGSVVVGWDYSDSGSNPGYEAFRWTSDGGMVSLGNLPGRVGSVASGVSADGSIVVGGSYEVSAGYPRYTPFYWTADAGMRELWDVLLSHGVDPAADGWSSLGWTTDVSADGNTIIGLGYRNNKSEAFVATLGAPDIVASAFQFNDLPHRIVTTFDQDVSGSLGTDDLLIENLTTQQTIPSSDFALAYDASTNTATFSYTGNASGINGILPDGNYRATLLAAGITNGSGTAMPGDVTFDFFFLNGDANRDGQVNLSDFNILAANFGQSDRDFTQGDFTYDGVVNLADFNILASRFGQVLAASTAPQGLFGLKPVEDFVGRNNSGLELEELT